MTLDERQSDGAAWKADTQPCGSGGLAASPKGADFALEESPEDARSTAWDSSVDGPCAASSWPEHKLPILAGVAPGLHRFAIAACGLSESGR